MTGTLEPVTITFTMPIELPFVVPQPDCCPSYMVEIDTTHCGHDNEHIQDYQATYTHRANCDVWRYI